MIHLYGSYLFEPQVSTACNYRSYLSGAKGFFPVQLHLRESQELVIFLDILSGIDGFNIRSYKRMVFVINIIMKIQ